MHVGNLFKSLPVRRRELERNVKRDYSKVLGLLQAYASICVGVKFSVSNQPSKGCVAIHHPLLEALTTCKQENTCICNQRKPHDPRECVERLWLENACRLGPARPSICNEVDAKTVPDPAFRCDPRVGQPPAVQGLSRAHCYGYINRSREVRIVGHISRPVVGEGRNAPDRQMFFVNGRPCVLPQVTPPYHCRGTPSNFREISKAFNEVYKGFNVTQSPFILADLLLDTSRPMQPPPDSANRSDRVQAHTM